MQLKRVVVFLPDDALSSCEVLAKRYAVSRSEVVRIALAEGMAAAVRVLERLRETRLLEAAGADGSRHWRVQATRPRTGRGRPRKSLDPDRAVSLLLDYGRALRAADPGLSRDALSDTLRLHGQVIGVAPDDVDDVVLDALAQILSEPQLQPVADPSRPPE